MRVVPQAKNCREVEVGNRVYRTDRTGLWNVPDEVGRVIVKGEGGQQASLSGTAKTGQGYRCVDCGFGCWFTTCSRCGGNAIRET